MPARTMDRDHWLAVLRQSGCRVTAALVMLIEILVTSETPLSAEQAWHEVRQRRPETGRATVYRTVEKLESLGLVRRVHGYKGCSRFMPVYPEPTMLFICLDCGRADYLDRQPPSNWVSLAEQCSGHRIRESHIQLFGTCATCLQDESRLYP